MDVLILPVTKAVTFYLSQNLPLLSQDWWRLCVVSQLSFQQQRFVEERSISELSQLDLAALLRIFDKNWYELSERCRLPRDGRSWLKELQLARNRWAHQGATPPTADDMYRDLDTLSRFMRMLGADTTLIEQIAAKKSECILQSQPQAIASPKSAESDSKTPATTFFVGQVVALRSNPITLVPILEVIVGGAETRYLVFHGGRRASYYESQLLAIEEHAGDPALSSIADFHAQLSALMINSPSSQKLTSLRAGRVNFVPYQYRPVLRLLRADRPRLLIADEVGVGKTIEAALIIQELQARMELSRILILCPKSLVAERKWEIELKRFDQSFTALDGPLLRQCIREAELDGEWPRQYARAIVPFSLFDSSLLFGSNNKRRKDVGLVDLDPAPKFDLIIVDEAHHLRNSETLLHQGIRFFCDNAEAVVFLTATPVQLGSEDLFTLLNMLRPDLIMDKASFEQMAEPNGCINKAVEICRHAGKEWISEAREQLLQVASTRWGRMFLVESPAFEAVYDRLNEKEVDDAARVKLIRDLEELYTFGSIINRTRRRDIGDFTVRKPETLTVPFTQSQATLHNSLLSVVARILSHAHGDQNVKFMMTTIRRQAASCIFGLAPLLRSILDGRIDSVEFLEVMDAEEDFAVASVDAIRGDIENLLSLSEKLDRHDPKLEALINALREKGDMGKNKVLVFSTFRNTLAYLAERLTREGFRFGVVHGGVVDDERAELRRRFALPRQDSHALDVLLSSEVGSEGLDFQFCDMLVNYDLPWNPMRVEQRIGRIDRYGQESEAVAIINLITPGTIDAEIYDRCLRRIGVFEHAVGGCEEILGEVAKEIRGIADSFHLSEDERAKRLHQLADNGIRRLHEDAALEEQESALFGLNLKSQRWEDDLKASSSFWLSAESLARLVEHYLQVRLSRSDQLADKPVKSLRVGQADRNTLLDDFRKLSKIGISSERVWELWLKGTEPSLSFTFDQALAVEDPKLVHITALHPLVRQAGEYLAKPEASVLQVALKSNEIPSGEYPFAIYRWEKLGLRTSEDFVVVSTNEALQQQLFDLLPTATDLQGGLDPAGAPSVLEPVHHGKWREESAVHVAQVEELVEHRKQSLRASHQARKSILEERITLATNEKIRLMKESELARAEADFTRRMSALEPAIQQADIRAELIAFGTVRVQPV